MALPVRAVLFFFQVTRISWISKVSVSFFVAGIVSAEVVPVSFGQETARAELLNEVSRTGKPPVDAAWWAPLLDDVADRSFPFCVFCCSDY